MPHNYQKKQAQSAPTYLDYELAQLQASYNRMAGVYVRYVKNMVRMFYAIIALGLAFAFMVLYL